MTTQIKRSKCWISPETSSPKLKIEIVGHSMISGITPVGLSSKCRNRFWMKPYGGLISKDLVNHISPTLGRKPDIIAIHIGTSDITNDDCSNLQMNVNAIVFELSPSTKIVLFSIILHHDKNNINVKVNHRKKIMKQFCKTNKPDLINNSNIKDQNQLQRTKTFLHHLNEASSYHVIWQ